MKKQNKQRLIELALEQSRAKYPNFPDHCRPTPSYTDKTSNGLTKCIKDFLNFSGWQAERISNMGRVIDKRETYTDIIGRTRQIGSIQYIPGTGTNGTADISATIKGLSVKIEVKIGKDRQSEAQRNYQQSVERSGGLYFIAKDFDSFITWYDENFI